MPRRKKKAMELTNDEAIRRLFPRRVVNELKRIANPPERSQPKRPKQHE
jgi:hypothetical protein